MLKESREKSILRIRACALAVLGLLPLTACIASAPGNGSGSQQQPIQVTVTSATKLPASIPVSTSTTPSTVQFGATLTGTTNTAVTWSLSLSSSSNSSASGDGLGAIDSNGNYTAPQTINSCPANVTPCELQVVVTATSQANTSDSGQALINVHVIVAISPTSATLGQGANLQFTAAVIGTPSGASYQGVNWGAACTTCASGQGGGAFDPNNGGLFIAPPFEQGVNTPQIISASATSAFDPTQYASATVTVDPTDPLGTASPSTTSGAEISCPSGGLSGGTCYQIDVSCPNIADWTVYLKVNTPAGTPIGTVLFSTGSGGGTLYDNSPDFFYNTTVNGGAAVVQGILSAGYTTVQLSFGSAFNSSSSVTNGWLQGPGGVRRLACRYATAAQWVYTNIHNSSKTAAFCATGNSGGSGAIGYSLSEYGQNSIFNMAEPTSGPVMTQINAGCNPSGSLNYDGTTACTGAPTDMSYSLADAAIIDTAYQAAGQTTPTLCTDGVNGSNTNNLRFESDSIDYSPSKSPALPISGTVLNAVFGGQDTTNAVPQGEWWWASVAPKPTQACVSDAPHAIPAAPSGDGVTQIVNDIMTLCKVP